MTRLLLLSLFLLLTACASGVRVGPPESYTYGITLDQCGRLISRTDARGVVTDYTWDALNRLTTVEYPSDSSLDVTLTYDSVSGCGSAPKGRLCSVTDASGITEYEYNDLGHLTNVTETRGGLTFTTAYTYDLAGNVLTITLDSGRVITYSRNANGQVDGVSGIVNAGSVQFASSVTYAPFGPMTGMTYGNALSFSATYDQDYNPVSRTVSGGIYNHTYDTDDNGNIIQVGGTDYTYDALNRMDGEDSGSAITYTFDAANNRLSKVSGGATNTTVPSTSNRISAVGSDSITYDSSGNYVTAGTHDYTWNAAGNLAEVEVSSSTVGTYSYNASHQRTKKVAGGNTVHYVYGLNGLLYGEYDNSGNLIREYVYLNDQPLAQIDAGSPEVLTYLHTDHLGTPRYGTNAGGSQVWAANADAFGVGTPSGSVTVNIRMPGQYYDAESGLFYNGNRYYNPSFGRYISSDPIGLEGGPNTYNYANVSPVMFIDPEGLAPDQMCLALYTNCGGAIGGMLGFGAGAVAGLPSGGTLSLPLGVAASGPGAVTGGVVGNQMGQRFCPDTGMVLQSAEHTKNQRPSNKPKHEAGQARKGRDYGGEKGDVRRNPPKNPPAGWEGPWPPKK